MPLFIYRCQNTGYRVQGFASEDTSEDHHIYEPMTCPVCHEIHHVNPTTGAVLGVDDVQAAPRGPSGSTLSRCRPSK